MIRLVESDEAAMGAAGGAPDLVTQQLRAPIATATRQGLAFTPVRCPADPPGRIAGAGRQKPRGSRAVGRSEGLRLDVFSGGRYT